MLDEYQELFQNREDMYNLLARFFLLEIDKDTFARLQGLQFPDGDDEPDLDAGYKKLASFISSPGEDPITDLAVDYARVILGAGVTAKGAAAYPYESVYTSIRHLVLQEAYEDVYKIYHTHGLAKSQEDYHEDHIALELQFMAHLCGNAVQLAQANETALLAANIQEQKDFQAKHLANWVPAFCRDVIKYSASDFYIGAALLLRGFTKIESGLLSELVSSN